MFSRFLLFITEKKKAYIYINGYKHRWKAERGGVVFLWSKREDGFGLEEEVNAVWISLCKFQAFDSVMSAYYTCTLQLHCLLHMYHYLLFTSLIFTGFILKVTYHVNRI